MATWKAANARAREYCAAASGTTTVPRVVTSACDSEAPHFLIYVTEDELALLLHFTAETPAGVEGPEGLLCAPPKTKRPKIGDLVVFSSTPVRHDGDDTDALGPSQPSYYYQNPANRPPGLGAGENTVLQRHTAENTVAHVVHYARRQGVGKWEVKVRPIITDYADDSHDQPPAPVRLWEQDFRPTHDDNDGLLPPVARLLDDHEAAQFKTRIPSLLTDVPDGGAGGGGGGAGAAAATADLPQNANRDLVTRFPRHAMRVVLPRRQLRVGNPLAPEVGDYVASVPADRYGGYTKARRKRKRLQRLAGMVAVVTEVTAAADRSTILEVRGRPIDADPESAATDHYDWKAFGHDFVPQELRGQNGRPSGELLPPIAKKLTEDEMRELLAG